MSSQALETPLATVDTTAEALAREKSHFLARNADRCMHLVVRIVPGDEQEGLVIRAAFTLDEARAWHEVEAFVSSRDLTPEAGPDRCLITAFGQLDDGISTARIARLFAPLSVGQRIAVDRA